MKKVLSVVLVIVMLFSLSGCTPKKDSERFKKEYESINGNKTSSGKTVRTVSIDSDNPMVYSTAEDIVERIENGETFAVFFGFAACPWCRTMIEQLLKSAKDNNITRIYYVDVLKIRDKYELDKSGELKKTEEGSDGYNELIDLIGSVLDDYTIEGENGEKIDTNEKRIFAPNVVAVVNGTPIEMIEGISSSLKEPYDELTEAMKEESYNSFKCLWDCLSKESTMCTKNAC